MAEAKHTPGPWEVYVAGSPYGTIHIGQADHAEYTPHASDVAYQTVGCDPTSVQMANARLIAAAPELLAALQGFLDLYVPAANSGDWGNWDPEEEVEVIAARAAIAKATGSAA